MPEFQNEAGGHRIQRVPPTERRGRVHTSTVTVTVLLGEGAATADTLSDDDFALRWFSGTGKGGQHRNKHQNCVEVTHGPTGLRRTGQSTRSRESNLREAMDAIRADLTGLAADQAHGAENSIRKAQVGAGMRGDKRRTYRFQEDGVHDHITGKRARATEVMRGQFDRLWS